MTTLASAFRVIAVCAAIPCAASASPFSVKEDGGVFRVLRGETPVATLSFDRGDLPDSDVKTSMSRRADGTCVWNRWSEERDRRFRFEVVLRADGAVEATMSGEMDSSSPYRLRRLDVRVPAHVFAKGDIRSVCGSPSRDTSNTAVLDRPAKAKNRWRWLAAGGLTYDFCPLGAANEDANGACSVDGVWDSDPQPNGDVVFSGGALVTKTYGGWVAAKVVIREGAFADFDRLHARRSFQYNVPLGFSRLYSFGAPKTGQDYADGNHPFDAMRASGWVTDDCAAWRYFGGNKTHVGHPEGAFYSCVSGKGPAGFRVSGLPDGYYIMTVSAGNYTGIANRFDVSVDGVPLAKGVVVPERRAKSFSRVFHVSGGEAVIGFDGDYIVSVIGVQPLLMDGEDFSMGREFWVEDGYEPSHVYRNEDDRDRKSYAVSEETYFLPVPGEEARAVGRRPPRPVDMPDRSSPALRWMDNPRVYPLFFNWANFSELDDMDVFAAKLDEQIAGKGVNLSLISGFLSRHTYPAHEDRTVAAIARCTKELHKRGIKAIDHHDITLCWNEGSGFRVMAERLDEMSRTRTTGLPSFQFCISNQKHNERQFAYLRRLVAEADVDGFQLDELRYWGNACVCASCREKFHADTGLYMPMNECSPHWTDKSSPLYRAWVDWRIASVASWDVEARRRLKDLRPDLVLCEYTTDDGFLVSYSGGASQDLTERCSRGINFPGVEVMSRNPYQSHRSLVSMRKVFNTLSMFAGSPVYGWYYGRDDRTFYFAWCLANMCGQSALLINEDVPRTSAVPDYIAFGASSRNMPRAGATPVAEVAILFSRPSRDWNPNVKFHYEALGIAQELECLHVPYEFLPDEKLDAATLAKYKVLFLSAAECMSDAEVAASIDFARRGGTVHMSVRAGAYDERGMARAAWPFEGCLGACGRGRILFEPDFGGVHRFVRETTPSREFAAGDLIDDPKYVAGFRARLRRVVGDAAFWKVNAPERVYAMPWLAKDGSLVVHLLNATGATPPSPGEKPPVHTPDFVPVPSEITIALPAAACGTRAVMTSPDFDGERELPVSAAGAGSVSVTVPPGSLTCYAIVRFPPK